jgi:hypothetical protein
MSNGQHTRKSLFALETRLKNKVMTDSRTAAVFRETIKFRQGDCSSLEN